MEETVSNTRGQHLKTNLQIWIHGLKGPTWLYESITLRTHNFL